jgi:hypothetical protein
VIGADHGQPVKALVRAVPAHVVRDIRRRTFDGKGRKAWQQPQFKQIERGEEFMAESAVYALIDTRNFYLAFEPPEDVARYAALLQREIKAGEEVLFDGAWTEPVKRAVFEDFPDIARRISDCADTLTRGDMADEVEATDSF